MKVVEGKDKGKIVLYALSTCVWCKKVKKLLKKLGVKYSFIFVDELEGKEKEKIMKQLEKWNPRRSFPTVVINDENCIVGYKEYEIKEALGL
jgi:glutaredoxin